MNYMWKINDNKIIPNNITFSFDTYGFNIYKLNFIPRVLTEAVANNSHSTIKIILMPQINKCKFPFKFCYSLLFLPA